MLHERCAAWLRRPRWSWPSQVVVIAASFSTLGVTVSVLWAVTVIPQAFPSPTGHGITGVDGSKLYDENDEVIAEFRVQRQFAVPLARIPQSLRDAVIAVEDSRFYSHFGIDPIGLARAVYRNVRHRRIVEGGSTITQQLARLLFLTHDKSFGRKLKEALLALELERRYSKDRILEMYLNQIYMSHGAYGVEAGARTYFGKSVTELALPEVALLAGLPRAPALYSPFNHPDRARRRRAHVLKRMVKVGAITPTERKAAAAADLGLTPPAQRRATGQYFVEHVRRLLAAKYGGDMVFRGGLRVYSTLSPHMQRLAEKALRDGLEALEARTVGTRLTRPGTPGRERPEGAIVTIEPETGYIKAMVGGSDFRGSEFNRAVQAKRQPGSAFKPFVYLAALEAGLTPATVIEDSPVKYPGGRTGRSWEPDNYDGRFRGPITLQEGAEASVNVVTVKLQELIGTERTISLARRLGIRSPLHRDLTLALGSSDVSLLELTSAYSALANRGVWVNPTPIRYITDAQGRLLEEHVPRGEQAVSAELAYVITHMLMGAVERGTAKAAKVLGRPIASKTGTTNDFSNAWFIGYTPSLITGVWVGYDRPRSLGRGETGARVALPIWVSYMGRVLAGLPPGEFQVPEGVVFARVDLDPAGRCTRPVVVAFLRGTEPSAVCGGFLDRLRQLFRRAFPVFSQ